MDVDAYLHRIGYSGPRSPNADTLCALHRAHMLTVPFENLDIHLGRPIVLDEELLFEKIVRQRRGGFCYELNGLFALLLRQLHFDVTLLSARVHEGGMPGPEFDHMTLLVQLEERWLADVGFGESFMEPVRLDDPTEQLQHGASYRIDRQDNIWMLMERRLSAEWAITYQFDMKPRQLEDFSGMCHWHQHSSRSHFTQKRICSLASPDGRVTLSDMKLIVTENGVRREEILSDEREYSTALKTYFGIEIYRE
jgi:N-hydroxyarylamine O-acetyltransferase